MSSTNYSPHIALLLGILFGLPLFADEPLHDSVPLGGDTEMELRLYPSEGDALILGLPCDQGTGIAEARAGEVLSQRRLEVWLADLLGAHFLPIAPSSMRTLGGEEVASLIRHAAQQREGKRIVLTTGGYGAIPALRGARIWQQQHPDDHQLLGAILFFPMLSEGEPQPGKPLEYLPIVGQSRLPIVIMQPGNSPHRFWVERLKHELEGGGSRVHIELLPGVRPGFYSRQDQTPEELAMTQRLPQLVEQALEKLKQLERQP